MGLYDRRRALVETVPVPTPPPCPPMPGGLPPADPDWPWRAIRDVSIEALLRVVHDLGAPTQARVDAASALLAASQNTESIR